MNDPRDDVAARKWQNDFDELAGRTAPPDRLATILERAAAQRLLEVSLVKEVRELLEILAVLTSQPASQSTPPQQIPRAIHPAFE